MPTATIDGIATHYEQVGSGPPLLMFSPGGFNAVVGNWSSLGVYAGLDLMEQLSASYTCVAFDRREAGRSGGRIERVGWANLVAHGVALLDHLEIERAHLMGGCVGCSVVAATAVAHPERVASMVLYSPAGGAHYRMGQHERFNSHLTFIADEGMQGVVDRARANGQPFNKDPKVGPWGAVLAADEAFAAKFLQLDVTAYRTMIIGMARNLFDRDTVPGVEPEDLMNLDVPALIVPGEDRSHARSAARYLEECLPRTEYWDVPVAEQTRDRAPARILKFLDGIALS